jgi:hypothetical protein
VESYALLVNDVELILGILSFCRIAVGSWNVAGMLPPDDIDLREWLDTSEPADIYVIGRSIIKLQGATNPITM